MNVTKGGFSDFVNVVSFAWAFLLPQTFPIVEDYSLQRE